MTYFFLQEGKGLSFQVLFVIEAAAVLYTLKKYIKLASCQCGGQVSQMAFSLKMHPKSCRYPVVLHRELRDLDHPQIQLVKLKPFKPSVNKTYWLPL